ncbi:T-cell differentiation antigen CD6-like isoform X2 [Pempheris klunzingeri]|uniref:T-cell differentiation antigen CD6-like isoform X2 n=1 Tax=Pempheris klunzingeri TaxID=3127111 RepID=UPI00397EBCB1
MKLVKCILIVQLSCLCQGVHNSSTPTVPADVQVTAEGNDTRGVTQEDFNSHPHIHKLTGKCNFTLRMTGNRSGEVVAFAASSTEVLIKQICQDLDCGGVYHVSRAGSPPNTSCFHDCLYREGRLQNCSQSVGGHCTVIAGVVCGHQAVRLAGGPDRCAGRVELWRDGRWGTVCDDQWDLRDADVACGQLGCGYAISVTGQDGSFPPGRGPVHLDELNCTGKEENLWACPAAQDEPDCGHKEDAGVVCSEMRAVRLTGGLDHCSGKVEIHRNGSWGTVCDNCWNKNMASMVCSMLQCGAEAMKFSQFLPALAHNNGTLWFYQCGKDMQSLWQCREIYNKMHLCTDSKASGIICNGSLGFPTATTVSAANATVITSWTTKNTGKAAEKDFLTPQLLSTTALCLLFLVFLIINTILCCHYRRRHAFLLQQSRTSPRPASENHHNYQDAVNLVKVTTNPPQADDSQRYKTDTNALMRPSGLDSLFEEDAGPKNEVMGVFTGHHGGPSEPQYARVSKISVDSFDTSSTSSEECYENTNNGYVEVTPDDEGDGPIYSPVSPDQNFPSEDDYDDIGN